MKGTLKCRRPVAEIGKLAPPPRGFKWEFYDSRDRLQYPILVPIASANVLLGGQTEIAGKPAIGRGVYLRRRPANKNPAPADPPPAPAENATPGDTIP